MNAIEAAQFCTWNEVQRALRYFYPDDKNDYSKLFIRIRKMRKVKQRIKDERIVVKVYHFNPDGSHDPDGEYHHIATNKYSMSLRPWLELANIQIEEATLNHITVAEFMAHFLWEITFYGNEKQMKAFGKELHKRVDSVKKGLAKKKSV